MLKSWLCERFHMENPQILENLFLIIVVSFDFASQWIMSDFSYGSPSKWLGRPARPGRLMNVLVENKARSFWFWKQRQRLPVKHKLTFTKCSPYRLFLSESLRKSRRGPWNANVSTHKIVGLNRRRCFLFTAHALYATKFVEFSPTKCGTWGIYKDL